MVIWNFNNNERLIMSSTPTQNYTEPEYEGRITLITSTGSLELRNLTLNDNGTYGVSIAPVGEPPQVGSTRLDIYDVVESSSVSVFCSFSGSSLSFLWMNGSSEITANDRIQLNRTDGGSYLTILNVTQYDQGTYTCHVSNPGSSKNDLMTLLVKYGPENTQLSVSPLQEDYEEGSDITLSCFSESRPPAEFTWFLNGEQLPHSGTELKLMKVQMSQKGSYTCRAFNHITERDQTSQRTIIVVSGKSEKCMLLLSLLLIVIIINN
uniref:Ig-like domain-containing protein n=1 Tax=Fundulus heteroclitus TaxID=8078 RepID=A0A3Q2P998_FUNHE